MITIDDINNGSSIANVRCYHFEDLSINSTSGSTGSNYLSKYTCLGSIPDYSADTTSVWAIADEAYNNTDTRQIYSNMTYINKDEDTKFYYNAKSAWLFYLESTTGNIYVIKTGTSISGSINNFHLIVMETSILDPKVGN